MRNVLVGLLALSFHLLPARPCRAQYTPPRTSGPGEIGEMIVQSFQCKDAELVTVINLLRAQTGAEIIIIEPSVKPYGHVTLDLKGRSLNVVMEQMCLAAGAALQVLDGVFIIGPKADGQVILTPESTKKVQEKRFIAAKIRLSHIAPTRVVEKLGRQKMIPPDLSALLAYDVDYTIIARGTPKAIAELKELIKLLDVEQKAVRLELRLLRFKFEADGSWDVETISSPQVSTLNNEAAHVETKGANGGFDVQITPRINGDRTVSVQCGVRLFGPDGAATLSTTIHRRIPPDRKTILLGRTDSTDKEIQEAVRQSHIPSVAKAHTAYYLQITPVVQDHSNR